MTPTEQFAVVAFAGGCLITALMLLRRSPDDAESGVSLGPDAPAPAPPPASHFVAACMFCHRVLRGEPITVRAGDVLRVSHGICPECERIHYPPGELEQWAQDNTMLKVPGLATAQP